MAYGKNVSSDAMNQHKAMAGAGMKGNFGVKAYPGRVAAHPDLTAGTGRKGAMEDSMRSAAHKGMQGAPDHGPMGPDHFDRG